MNFQQVEQGNGNLVTMFGVITEFVGEGINPKSNKPWKKAKIRDDAGITHTVTIRGELPTVAMINQRVQFSLSTYQGTFQGQPYTGYSGFWNSSPQVNQQPNQQSPQQGRQAPSRAPKQDKPDWDAIAEGKVRHGIVCAAIQSGQIKIVDEGNIEYWKNYIINGEVHKPIAQEDDAPPWEP